MKNWKRKCALLLVMALCLSPLQANVAKATQENEELSEEQNADMDSVSGDAAQKPWDGITMQDVWETDTYKVTFLLNNYWQDGYTADMVIENLGENEIEDWVLKFPTADDITNIWNASTEQEEEGVLTIKNAGWNRNIPAGGSVTLGFNAASAFDGFPGSYTLLWSGTEKEEIPADDYVIEYLADSEWEDGFSSRILITNNTNYTMEGWRLSFDFERDIESIWCAEIESVEDGHYTIKNAGYNADIAPGQTISFGFKGSGGISAEVPSDMYLYSQDLSGKNTGGNSNTGNLTEEDLNMDTDGDGLTDAFETMYGLNPENPDTDGDGLSDYEEIYLTRTSPFVTDTDENGISDAEEDVDLDGLGSLEEIQYGTNPADNDTDGDNLLDNEEIYTYGTDPLQKDTDGDGLSDYDDILLGFSPLLADTDGNGIMDSGEKVSQTKEQEFEAEEGKGLIKVCVSTDASGNLENNMEILNMDQVDLLSSDVVGLVGVPVEISTTAAFETAEIIFYYDEASLGGTAEEDLSMLWYDKANNRYQMLDCTVDTQNNCVSYTTTHFSTYMLVDSREWSFAWQMTNISEGSFGEQGEQGVDIVIIVEDSLSLSSTRTSLLQSSLLKFVDSMQEGDEAAIVSYNGQTLIWSQFSGNKVSLKNKIASLDANTGVDEAKGLAKAVELLAARDNEKPKVILFISNGYFHVVEDTINACISHKFPVYSVSLLGYGSPNAVFVPATQPTGYTNLIKLSQLTGGICYKGELGGWQDTLMPKLHRETANSPQKEDTDGDGLCDVYETAGMILANGRIIHTDPHKADTDGDGLTDYEEAGILYTSDHKYIRTDGQEDYLKYYVMRSNPTLADTDCDGIPDGSDPHPWLKEEEWVAGLDNRYLGVRYLRIKRTDGSFAHGGNQGWWEDVAPDKRIYDLVGAYDCNKYYRLVKLGCGVVAMCDMELYLTQQNQGYQIPYSLGPYLPTLGTMEVSYDTNTGIIQEADYRKYVEERYQNQYWMPETDVTYLTGLWPTDMAGGIKQFLEFNNSPFDTVEWAPYFTWRKADQKEAVLDTISFMLKNDIPVVFSYDHLTKKITLYSSLNNLKTNKTKKSQTTRSHYMTITGLYKYLVDTSDAGLHYEYVLKVVSWGEEYYIKYNDYADSLNCFSNILSVR